MPPGITFREAIFMKIGFIGFGLIGGSLAKIWRTHHPDPTVLELVAYDRHPAPSQDLLTALSDSVLSGIERDLDVMAQCDYLFLCAPVEANLDYLSRLAPLILDASNHCMLTDVGSTKHAVYQKALELGLDGRFIGGHPMAGSEKTGYRNAVTNLFENAYYILTPTPAVTATQLAALTDLVLETKAIPVRLEAARHDAITAAVSHVPHIISASLVQAVRDEDGGSGETVAFVAGGFRDTTRIAASSPDMWRDICMDNREPIRAFLRRYRDVLTHFDELLETGDAQAIHRFFSDSREYRNSLTLRTSALASSYELKLYIPDRPGSIAIIASLLGANGISIRNIGIAHNREYSEGVLRVEFYDEHALEKAREVLTGEYFHLYESCI